MDSFGVSVLWITSKGKFIKLHELLFSILVIEC